MLIVSALAGCACPGHPVGRCQVSACLAERAGHGLARVPPSPAAPAIPPGVTLQDGLSEDEAVAIALWNNAPFQELLADLEIARADLITAGYLTNPDFSILFPVGPKPLEFTLNVPVEALWLRPQRVAAAELESQRVGQRLVQDGLNLIRDVRVAYADLLLAQDRLRIAEEAVRLREEIAALARSRLRAGAVAEQEVITARIDALIELEQSRRTAYDVELARQRLAFLLGMPGSNISLSAAAAPLPRGPEKSEAQLVEQAVQGRPDLCAAQLAVNEAARRARLARFDWFQFAPQLNAKELNGNHFGVGPALRTTVPVFNQNQGPIARADAEVERLSLRWVALRDTIVLEVRSAHTRLLQAQRLVESWDARVLPAAAEAVGTAERAYRGGGTSMLMVLENSRQLLAAQLRRAEAAAELRRARAELDRSVGHSSEAPPRVPAAASAAPIGPARVSS